MPLVHSICLSLGHLFCKGMQFLSAYREQLSGKQKHNPNNIVHMEDWNTSTASTRLLKEVCKDSLVWTPINKIKSFSSTHFLSDIQRKVQVFFPWSYIVLSVWIIWFQYFLNTVSTTSITLPSASGKNLCNGIIYNSLLWRFADNLIVNLFLKLWMNINGDLFSMKSTYIACLGLSSTRCLHFFSLVLFLFFHSFPSCYEPAPWPQRQVKRLWRAPH